MKFESVDEMLRWMDKASDNVLKDRTCEVVFMHRTNCPHIVGLQKSADQTCPCRPKPMLAYQ